MKLFVTASLCLVLFFIASCTSRPVEPTRTSRHTIDTIFQNNIIMLQPEIDSLCELVFQREYQKAVDSMMALRREEIDVLVQ